MRACASVSATALLMLCLAGCGSAPGSAAGGNPPGPTIVTFTFTGNAPTAVAARIGSGPFTGETLSSGALSLSIPPGTTNYAVAYVCPSAPLLASSSVSVVDEDVIEASTADGTSFNQACARTAPASSWGALTGTVDASAIPGASFVSVVAGSGGQSGVWQDMSGSGATVSNFSLTAPAASDRVEVVAYVESAPGAGASLMAAAARNFDGQAVPGALNGGNAVVLGAADQTKQVPITYSNVPSGYSAPLTQVEFEMAGGAGGFALASGTTSWYPALPAAAAESGDQYVFFATAYNPLHAGEAVVAEMASTAASPVSFAFPAPWSYAGPAAAALPSFDFAYSGFSGGTGVLLTAFTSWSEAGTAGAALANRSFHVSASRNFLNGASTVAFPDLSSLPGFPAPPASGTRVSWVAQILENGNGAFQSSASGSGTKEVMNSGAYNVP